MSWRESDPVRERPAGQPSRRPAPGPRSLLHGDQPAVSTLDSVMFWPGRDDTAPIAVDRCRAELEPGRRLASYEIVRVLGAGGQATVYVARDTRLERLVALKVLDTSRWSRSFLRRFRREAESVARLDHPGICAIHEADVVDGRPYIAMRLVGGVTLADHLESLRARGRRPPARWSLELIERVAAITHVAHEAGIVHRDLKPGNIMVQPDGMPVLLDFGIAQDTREVDGVTGEAMIGTPVYMAPELLDPRLGDADRRADVFALGVTLYECLTMRRPFTASGARELCRTALETEPVDPRSLRRRVGHDLRTVIEACLAKSPDDRYQTTADLREDLRRVRQHRPILVRSTVWWRRALHCVRRNPGLAAVLAAVVLTALAGALVTSLWLHRTSETLETLRAQDDARYLEQLQGIANDDLWPTLPITVPAMDRWLDEAIALDARRAELASSLHPVIEKVARRRHVATTIERRSIEEHRDAWDHAVASIAASERYAGLTIVPQIGLVPLGADRASGLEEFAHLPSGAIPHRDPETGALRLTERSGIVFVLIPGGRFEMGSYWPSPERPVGSPNVDPHSCTEACDERPVHEVQLAPFFLGKCEVTQGQWLSLAESNPSRWRPGSDATGPITRRHPVEFVRWQECQDVMTRSGLELPTEAQWEYAARAGTTTVWCTGDERASLIGAANLVDRAAARAGVEVPYLVELPQLDDGYVHHAPVGSLRPNGFGLHDVHGNVWEFVRDFYGPYDRAVRPGDGLRLTPDQGIRILRGGGYYESVRDARCARRYDAALATRTFSAGLRAARPIDAPVPDGADGS